GRPKLGSTPRVTRSPGTASPRRWTRSRAAGVGPGTLYRHFPTRDELVLAVMDDGLTDLYRLGVELLDEPDQLKVVHRWLDAYIEQSGKYQGLARTLANPPAAADEQSTC
ncbi:MAG TPA: TetR/AcrR family transcriptional regulator, partial [Amycolatopsis sp.]